MEERRTKWTTYKHLSLWFDRWEKNVEDLAFGTMINGEFDILTSSFTELLTLTRPLFPWKALMDIVEED